MIIRNELWLDNDKLSLRYMSSEFSLNNEKQALNLIMRSKLSLVHEKMILIRYWEASSHLIMWSKVSLVDEKRVPIGSWEASSHWIWKASSHWIKSSELPVDKGELSLANEKLALIGWFCPVWRRFSRVRSASSCRSDSPHSAAFK